MSRQIFTNDERRCLQELIIKYKLDTRAGNPAVKKTAWARLTNEYNSIDRNTRRTEGQLKKCFDNMKTRRKAELAAQIKDRMRTGRGPYRPSPEPSTSTAQDSMLVDGDVLSELTDLETTYSVDSDSVIPNTGSQDNKKRKISETPEQFTNVKDEYYKIKLANARLKRKCMLQKHTLEVELLKLQINTFREFRD